ncbi:MAG: ATP-binding protein [Actinomycetota bacterium]
MSGPGQHGRFAPKEIAIGGLAAAVVLGLGLIAALRSHEVAIERGAAEDAVILADAVTGVAVDLEVQVRAVSELARNATAPGAVPPPGFVPIDPATTTALPPALSAEQRTDRRVAAVLDRARDSGEVVVSGPIDLGDGPRTLVIAAAYVRDPNVGRPQTTVLRRERIAGWAVEPVDLGAVLARHVDEGEVASISDGPTTLVAGDSPIRDGLPERTVESHGRQLLVRAGDASGVGVRAPVITLVAIAALLAAASAAAVLHAARRMRAHREEAADRGAQVRLIGEVAPLVQQSLELADVLPAVAVQLSDHFGLAGVGLSTVSSAAGQVELFGIGEPPAEGTKSVLRPPEHLAAGETLSLALQRGGRSVALLQLVAGRDLDAAELQSLRALSELVTAAVVNAALYASQQDNLRRLRDLDALKTVFLGTASHELRTPVTAISGFSTLLSESWERFDEDQRRNFVERISANARSLSAVVQDLLDFSILDRGTLTVTIEPIDLAAVVEAVVTRLGAMFSEHSVVFSAEPAPMVDADVNGIERIVTNLLTNAVKFSPSGTTVTVTVGPAQDGYGAQVVVSDEGPGIPPEERHQVFTRFFRGSSDAVAQTRGVGIGLSVVAELIARLRGDVLVDEAPGGGARFTVRFLRSSTTSMSKEVAHAPTT